MSQSMNRSSFRSSIKKSQKKSLFDSTHKTPPRGIQTADIKNKMERSFSNAKSVRTSNYRHTRQRSTDNISQNSSLPNVQYGKTNKRQTSIKFFSTRKRGAKKHMMKQRKARLTKAYGNIDKYIPQTAIRFEGIVMSEVFRGK